MTSMGEGSLLADKAQQALWSALRSGRVRGGQFLTISQLVEILDCPIAPTREAVKQASSQGLLVTLPKRGIQVMEVTPSTIRECLDFRMVLDQEGARRRIMQGELANLPDLRKEHQAIRAAAAIDTKAALSHDAMMTDLSLHDYLADGLGNKQLLAAYEGNRMRIAIIQNARPFLQDRIVSAMDEHLAIIAALENADTDGATQAIRFHVEQTLRWWGAS